MPRYTVEYEDMVGDAGEQVFESRDQTEKFIMGLIENDMDFSVIKSVCKHVSMGYHCHLTHKDGRIRVSKVTLMEEA